MESWYKQGRHSHSSLAHARRVENGTYSALAVHEFVTKRSAGQGHLKYQGVTDDGTLVYWLDMPTGDVVLYLHLNGEYACGWYNGPNDALEDLNTLAPSKDVSA